MWGVISKSGIFTAAPKGHSQAEQWAAYEFRTCVGNVGETLHFQE